MMFPQIVEFIDSLSPELEKIPAERKEKLLKLANYIKQKRHHLKRFPSYLSVRIIRGAAIWGKFGPRYSHGNKVFLSKLTREVQKPHPLISTPLLR